MDLRIKWIASGRYWFLSRDAKIFYQPCFISEVCSDTLGVFSHFAPTINNDLGEQTVQIFWAQSLSLLYSGSNFKATISDYFRHTALCLHSATAGIFTKKLPRSFNYSISACTIVIFTSRAYNPTYLVNHSIFVAITELLMGKPVGLTFVIYMIIIMRGAIRVTSLYWRYTEHRNEDTAHCYVSIMSYVTSISVRHFLLLVHTLVLRNIYHFITS